MKIHIFNAGDRVVNTSDPLLFGTVVCGGRYGPENDVAIRWDHVTYHSEFPYSLPRGKYLRKLTKLELALS